MATTELADRRTQEEIERLYEGKSAEDIDNSLSGHIRWRTQYRKSVEGRLSMLNLNPTQEAVDYLKIDWSKYEKKCRDIEVGTQLIVAKDAKYYESTMKGVDLQTTEYEKLSNQMAKVLTKLTALKRETVGQQGAAAATEKEPKIKKELCPDILTKDTTPIEFRKFQRDYKVYYKESYMDKASAEGQKHYLLKCLDAELGERLLSLTEIDTPIYRAPGNDRKSCMCYLSDEFSRRYPVTNRRKDFFMQNQGSQQFTAYIDKLRNMAVEADLANANAEDLVVVMAIVGCKDDELRGELQKLEAPKLEDIRKIGEAHERKTFAEKGFIVKVNAAPHVNSSNQAQGARPKTRPNQDPAKKQLIDKLMKGKCFRCGEAHNTDTCPTKGQKINCVSCKKRGHLAKACFTEKLKSVSANQVTATQVETTVQARMLRASQSDENTVTAGDLPTVEPQSIVEVDGKIIDLDEPPKDIPPMWM